MATLIGPILSQLYRTGTCVILPVAHSRVNTLLSLPSRSEINTTREARLIEFLHAAARCRYSCRISLLSRKPFHTM